MAAPFRRCYRSCSVDSDTGWPGSPLALSAEWVLMRMVSTDVLQPAAVTRSVVREVAPCLAEAEPSVGAAAGLIGVMIVLAVVFPEAHRADLVVPPLLKRQVTTARTRIRLTPWRSMHIDEHARDCCSWAAALQPTPPDQSRSRAVADHPEAKVPAGGT